MAWYCPSIALVLLEFRLVYHLLTTPPNIRFTLSCLREEEATSPPPLRARSSLFASFEISGISPRSKTEQTNGDKNILPEGNLAETEKINKIEKVGVLFLLGIYIYIYAYSNTYIYIYTVRLFV